jgi:peptidoglycan hydrolase CwlO-like protein
VVKSQKVFRAMIDRITNLKDIEYYNNIGLLSELVLEAIKKQDTPKLQQMAKALSEITFYVNELHTNRWAHNKIVSECTASKDRAIVRARRVEDELNKLSKTKNYGL